MSQKSLFVCNSCGNEFPKWAGKCPACGGWNGLVETPVSTRKSSARGGSALGGKNRGEKIVPISLTSLNYPTQDSRLTTGIGEFDRVLGSGFVPGQVILLAGEPGIGKSTLLLQIANSTNLSNKSNLTNSVLYVCGEESPSQIKIRADRLGIGGENIQLLAETNVDELLSHLSNLGNLGNLGLLIVDSIQTLSTQDLASASGSVAQVKECAARIINFAKSKNITTILVGHVNKDGDIAGPKVLEHMVDTVMYLEGERFASLRLLSCVKNRFGDVGEVGVFQMAEKGFQEVKNPSAFFISESVKNSPGSVLSVVMEGTRPVLLEVQALVSKSAFNYPRRSASGFDLNRLYFLAAVLEKFLKIPLPSQDIYVNVTSGAKILEPAGDLALALAIVSSSRGLPLKPGTVAFGEVGLSGEVREVPGQKRRFEEAKKLGFKNILSPLTVKTVAEAVRLAL